MSSAASPGDVRTQSQATGGNKLSGRELNASLLIQAIHAHRGMSRADPDYWNEFCELIKTLCRATSVLIIRKDASGIWALLGQDSKPDDWLLQVWNESVLEHGGRSLQNGFAFMPLQDAGRQVHILTLVRANGLGDALLVMDIPERERAYLNELILRALLATDFPELQSTTTSTEPDAEPNEVNRPAQNVDEGLLKLLDLSAQVMNEEKFGAAVLVLVNGLATHYRAAQTALGWMTGDSMRVVAVSHLDRFERNTQNIQMLEEAFSEAAVEEREIWLPGDEAMGQLVTRQEELRLALGFAEQCSVPIHDNSEAIQAMIHLGFQEPQSERPGMENLQLVMDLLLPWLQSLQQKERWWGARLAASSRTRLEKFLGPENVWGRVFALAGTLLLLFVLFGKWEYRIEAVSQLTTDSTRFVSAQFDGRVDEVFVTAGDRVKEGTVLASLDTRELRQQEIDLRAERQRLSAEADKARAAGNLSELEIATARQLQAETKLTRVLQYLQQSRFIAPFDGVIVDGERKELLNAPVKKGDRLFRLARIDGLYVELLVPERDIRYVKPDAAGELRLLSRPDQKIPFKLSVFIPMAQVKGQEGNHFLIKAQLQQIPEEWWRTGMSGTALIEGGKQNIAWILTHRLIDTLLMKLWWFW